MGGDVAWLDGWDRTQLQTVADRYGTPVYVLDRARVAARSEALATAFDGADIRYAMKANSDPAVLETVIDAGFGLECASAGELHLALETAIDPARLHYTAVNPPTLDLDFFVECAELRPALTVTAGAVDTLERLLDRQYAGRVALRVNPGVGAGHHAKVTTGDADKFGVPIETAMSVLEGYADRLEFVGLHAHAGSGILGDDHAAHLAMVDRLVALATEAATAVPALEYLDIGGGFGVPYRPDQQPLSLEGLAAEIDERMQGCPLSLAIEPGRYLVAPAGVLLSRVNTRKQGRSQTIVGIDAGMTTLLRPMLYDAYHPIENLSADPETPQESVAVTGPICETGDVLATDRQLQSPQRGDLLAIGITGAYGFEMASTYNMRPRPARVVLDDTDASLSVPHQTLDELLADRGVHR
jgi:diaminopimelate decarboxylase